jgi:hypothetical protein
MENSHICLALKVEYSYKALHLCSKRRQRIKCKFEINCQHCAITSIFRPVNCGGHRPDFSAFYMKNILILCRIWGSHSGSYTYPYFWDVASCSLYLNDVSEVRITSVFKVQNYPSKKPARSRRLGGHEFFRNVELTYRLHGATSQKVATSINTLSLL